VPAGECGQEYEHDESHDDGDDARRRSENWQLLLRKIDDLHKVWKYDIVLESVGDPDQVQRVLVDADLLCQECCIVGAEERSAVGVDAQAEVSYSHLEHGLSDDVGDGGCDAGIHLCRIICWCVVLVVEIDKEDVGYQRRT